MLRKHASWAARSCARRASAAEYNFRDPFNIEERLTNDEVSIRDAVKKFAHDKLMPQVTDNYRKHQLPANLFADLGRLGILGATLTGYGCAGVTSVANGLIAKELERVDSGLRSAWSVTSSLVMFPIHLFGTEAQKQKYLPRLAAGELVGAFGLTEPEAGSDPGSMKTTFKDEGSHYLLNGQKTWITNAPLADVFIIWAKSTATGELRGFIVERGFGGLKTPTIEGKLSLCASVTGSIDIQDCRVPKENMLTVKGFRGPFECLNSARFGIAWGAIGAAEFCLDFTREYVLNRKQFGKPLAANQLVQYKLADIHTEISLANLAVYESAQLKDQGKLSHVAVSLLKRNSCQKALNAARLCRDMLGGNGIIDEYHVMRHMCNLETVNTYEGTADIHALILGRSITGLASF